MIRSTSAVAVLASLATAAAVHAGATPTVIYVDATAPAGGDGHSWESAFPELQDGLDLASVECLYGVVDVRVAGGTYRPGRGNPQRIDSFQVNVPSVTSARALMLRLDGMGRLGVIARANAARTPVLTSAPSVYITASCAGLSAGAGNPNWHDTELFPTILTGDLAGNDDDSNPASKDDNSFVVVSARVLDRGGFFPSGLFVERAANRQGAANGMALNSGDYARIEFTDCVFRRNSASQGQGAGLNLAARDPRVTRCVFEDNSCGGEESYGWGGGAWIGTYSSSYSQPQLKFCTFRRNSAPLGGGCLIDGVSVDAYVFSCEFIENHATGYQGRGGGLLFGYGSVSECRFDSNTASIGGGLWAANTRIWSSEFVGNQAEQGGGASVRNWVWVDGCQFTANAAGVRGGAADFAGMTQIRRSKFVGNHAASPSDARGGAVSTGGYPAEILASEFFGNTATCSAGSPLGGAICAGPATIDSCAFSGNAVQGSTGAIGGAVTMLNGGRVSFCTLTANRAQASGGPALAGGVALGFGGLTLESSILWRNSDSTGQTAPAQATAVVPGFAIAASWCNMSGLPLPPDALHNTGNDPLLMNPSGADGLPGTSDDDLSLRAQSTCIDSAGPVDPYYIYYSTDAAGNARSVDNPGAPNRSGPGLIADRGAYERQYGSPCTPSDLDASGQVATGDLTQLLLRFGAAVPAWEQGDLNGDGVVNTPDLQRMLLDFGCVYPQ